MPLPPVVVGATIAAMHGVPWAAYAPNVAALVAGLALVLLFRRGARAWMPVVATGAVLATLLGPDLAGVHRWIGGGGLRLNVSTAVAPWILWGLAAGTRRARGAALVVQAVHFAQPDAGQATALAAGMLPLLLGQDREDRALALVAALLAGATWLRHDPLPAVDHVERILALARSSGALAAAATLGAIVALFVPLACDLRAGLVRARRRAGPRRALAR